MTFVLGLTGSIGMGKTTTARLFADEGCAVWNADEAVHRLYAPGGAAVDPISREFPDAIREGAVSRDALKRIIAQDDAALERLERIVHPLVARDRHEFLANTQADLAVLDIPLLFETGADSLVDAVACVTVSPDIQRKRVLERGTMSETELETILARQMPDSEKRKRSDFVIETDSLEHARQQVRDIVQKIREKMTHA